jgi:hypothetical protein
VACNECHVPHMSLAARGVDLALHRLWLLMRNPFVVPKSICSHNDWEMFDMHMAGCRKCGFLHLCHHDHCPTSLSHEGMSICNITGVCTRMLNFCATEYVDTVQNQLLDPWQKMSPKHKKGVAKVSAVRVNRKKKYRNLGSLKRPVATLRIWRKLDIDEEISTYVRKILCTEDWDKSHIIEQERYLVKWLNSFTKIARDFKKQNPGILPIIPDLYTKTLTVMGNTRIPPDISITDRTTLASWCTEKIRHHLMILHTNFPDIIQVSRIQGIVVGLMYLMRCGIIVKGVVVLPRLQLLHDVLPLETHLNQMFNIKGKVITETENTIKQVLKSLSTNELIAYSTPRNV